MRSTRDARLAASADACTHIDGLESVLDRVIKMRDEASGAEKTHLRKATKLLDKSLDAASSAVSMLEAVDA